ncbi:dihydrofolate reductase family protein [Actinospica durhamensis]|uniref:Dihydrofolate reductase family protein n=1 Tax=Actinospica durhamensis TaxID=1508375 RepID=A0A941EU89_9ACTN|nr:dihydrofolate reductase family protein [Actinospica durhamensis]MBR7838217.1 dihydrofolate reductase family protein [Actinospica durhamensis]
MRTLISTAFISLDGVVEAPGGEPGYRNSGWTFKEVEFVPEAYAIKGQEQEESTALMMGRVSYEIFSPVWPGMQEFARYKTLPKYIVSTTLQDTDLVSDWGESTILRSLDDVAALKRTEGGPIIVHGSVELNHALADAGLIDRYHLLVFPLLLGAGKRLFAPADKDAQKLKLVEYEAYSNGVQKQIFDVVH